MKKQVMMMLILLLLASGCGNVATDVTTPMPSAQSEQTHNPSPTAASVEDQVPGTVKMVCSFTESPAAGILMGPDQEVYVGVPKKLYQISAEGKKSVFSDFSFMKDTKDYVFKSPCIWDMTVDSDGNIFAAAQDRILKISPDGKAETVLKYDFAGFCGASSIATDREGNFYIPSGSQVLKFNKQFENMEVFVDGAADGSHQDIFSIHFTPDHQAFYVTEFSEQSLVRYAIDEQGKAVDGKKLDIDFKKLSNTITGNISSPLDLVFDDQGGIFLSLDYTPYMAMIDGNGQATSLSLNDPTIKIHMLTFDTDKESIYFTTCAGNLYKYKLP